MRAKKRGKTRKKKKRKNEPEVTWTLAAGKDCDLRIPANLNHDGFRAALCSACTTPACGAIPELDGPGSPAAMFFLTPSQNGFVSNC